MDKETYKTSINKHRREKKTVLCCSICGEDNPNVIEMHHVYGRNNSDHKEPLCKNCHAKITTEQNKVSPVNRSSKASTLKKRAFQFISIGAIVKEIGQQLINFGHEMIQNE